MRRLAAGQELFHVAAMGKDDALENRPHDVAEIVPRLGADKPSRRPVRSAEEVRKEGHPAFPLQPLRDEGAAVVVDRASLEALPFGFGR